MMKPIPEPTYTVTLTNDELNWIWRAKLMLDDATGFKSYWGVFEGGVASRALFDLVGRIKDAKNQQAEGEQGVRMTTAAHCSLCGTPYNDYDEAARCYRVCKKYEDKEAEQAEEGTDG